MEIILRQDVDALGLEGDMVKVADGYARNYLIPKGIALLATNSNIKMMEMQRKKIEIKRLKAKEDADKIKEAIEGVEIKISQKVGEEGKLYGSVTSMDIAAELEKQDVIVDRRKILLEKPIKEVCQLEVPIRLYPEVVANIKVTVEALEE